MHRRRHRRRLNILIKSNNPKSKRIKLKLLIVLLAVLGIFLSVYVESVFNIAVKNLIEKKANLLGSQIINESIIKVYNEMDTDDVLSISYDPNGKISSVVVDSQKVNMINQQITFTINETLKSTPKQDVSVHLGSLTGLNWLQGRGPTLKIKMIPTGYISTKILSQFTAMGINQTKHSLYIDINISLVSSVFFYKNSSEIQNEVILSEAIIVGEVPNLYSGSGILLDEKYPLQ